MTRPVASDEIAASVQIHTTMLGTIPEDLGLDEEGLLEEVHREGSPVLDGRLHRLIVPGLGARSRPRDEVILTGGVLSLTRRAEGRSDVLEGVGVRIAADEHAAGGAERVLERGSAGCCFVPEAQDEPG